MDYFQVKEQGVYFVNDKFAFTFTYLELTRLRLLRAKLGPGQEADVRAAYCRNTGLIHRRWVRDYLLHALEGCH